MNILEEDIKKHRITEVECLIPDMSGIARGKIVPAEKFLRILRDRGLRLPESIFVQTVTGEYPEDEDVTSPENSDVYMIPDANTIRYVPWYKEPTAEVITDCVYADGSPVEIRLAAHSDGSQADVDALAKLVQPLVREQMAVFGEYPKYEPGAYTFLLDYVAWGEGDGMEHRNSTAVSEPGLTLRTPAGRTQALDTISPPPAARSPTSRRRRSRRSPRWCAPVASRRTR